MRNKALTDSVLMLCLSIVLFADQKNEKENERRLTQTRIHTDFYHFTEIGQIQPRDLPLQNGRDLGTRLQPIKLPEGGRLQPPPQKACTFGACLRNRSALILRLLQHIRPHILEGFSSHNPWNMCIWGSCGREVLHFVTQSNNVVLNKQGFW